MPGADSAELLAGLAAVVGALSHVASKRAVTLLSPSLFLTLRWTTAAVLAGLVALVSGDWRDFQIKPEIGYLLLGGLLGPVVAWNLYARAIARLEVSIAFAITQTSLLGNLALAVVLLGELPSAWAIGGALLILVGVSVLNTRLGAARPTRLSLRGVLLALGAAVCWSPSYVLWKLGLTHFSIAEALWLRALVPTVVMLPLVLSSERRTGALAKQLSLAGLVAAASVALLADLLSFGLQFSALQVGEVSTVTPIVNSSPLFLVGLSALLLGERISRWSLLGVVLIVSGVWLVAGVGR